MRAQGIVLFVALFMGAASASVPLTVDGEIDIDALVKQNHGWGRRQLLQRARRELRGKGDDDDSHGGGLGHGGFRRRSRDATIPLSFTTLTRSGYSVNQGDAPLGSLIAEDGSPIDLQLKRGGPFGKIQDPADTCGDQATNCTAAPYFRITGEQEISQNPDYTSILTVGRKIYSFVHFEGPVPSSLYFLELEQDESNGNMKVTQQMPVDWSEWGGLWLPCAGSVTPWGTHLGSEEYEPDARFNEAATSLDGPEATSLAKIDSEGYDRLVSFVRYYGLYYPFTLAAAKQVFNPYRYGYVTELRASKGFRYDNVKHYTMGRIAHEMGDVMPDRRTVYLTDDGTNTGLYKFVADRRNDLSAGKLYISKVIQQTPAGVAGDPKTTGFDIKWILLGKANQRQIERIIDSGIVFSDIFDLRIPAKTAPFCPTGYTSINAGQADAKHECLKLKDDSSQTKLAAAFLETRRYGAMLGGTTEWSKLEGLVYNEERSTVAFAASDVRYGMESNRRQGVASTKYDIGGPNDIRLEYNPCGCVYEIVLDGRFDSKELTPLVCGTPSTATPGNSCDIDGIASPDNLALLPEQQIMIIGEDTTGHQNDMLWAFSYATEELTRIATSPYGAEFTSTDYYEIGDYAYLTAVVQHPYGESDETRVLDGESTGRAGTVGYIGPMLLSDIQGKGIEFASIPYARTNSEKHNIRVTPSLDTN